MTPLMLWTIAAVGAFVAAMGLAGLLRPQFLVGFSERFLQSPAGLPVAVGLRLLLGVFCLLVAPHSRWPTFLYLIGGLSLCAAVALPFMGRAKLQQFVQWWMSRSPTFIRLWALAACVFGCLLVYAVV